MIEKVFEGIFYTDNFLTDHVFTAYKKVSNQIYVSNGTYLFLLPKKEQIFDLQLSSDYRDDLIYSVIVARIKDVSVLSLRQSKKLFEVWVTQLC